jgi:DNA-directed RNA polymerase specialized sigma24 family protein
MINIEEHRRFVYILLRKYQIPLSERDDTYQDFCVAYYSSTAEYNPEYAITTFIRVIFMSFLSHRAKGYNAIKRTVMLVGLESVEEQGEEVSFEMSLDMDRLYRKLPDLFKTLLHTKKTVAIIAQEEGVTRQAIETKLKKLMDLAKEEYMEDYA